MYLLATLALMLVLPVASVLIEALARHGTMPLIVLIGKWFVFWSAGVRLILAGLRQFFQPSFTAEQIFDLKSAEVLPIVRELGIANFSAGVVGVLSLIEPGFVLPAAVAAMIFMASRDFAMRRITSGRATRILR